ncbi:hypothetical protein [Streptomyces sp. NPDC018352]|uniref:hypothetical protein n=1 Tax=Streptomyces sp. NPDC018352 TaxID=3157194 RepID=UPI00340108AB
MNPDVQRELIPRDDALRLINALAGMKPRFIDAAEKWQLLDETGHVPASPSYAELIQHAADAQVLSRDVVQMTADFARTAHSKSRAGSAVLAHLATAATMSSHAVPRFAEAAEVALALSRPVLTSGEYLENRVVIDHATARAFLRRTSESLRDAAKELTAHLDFHRFFPASSPQKSAAPPPPGPSARHR